MRQSPRILARDTSPRSARAAARPAESAPAHHRLSPSRTASAVAVCCLGGALLVGCGSGAGQGYAAVGAAGEGAATGAPSGQGVELTPLDGSGAPAHRTPGGGGGDATGNSGEGQDPANSAPGGAPSGAPDQSGTDPDGSGGPGAPGGPDASASPPARPGASGSPGPSNTPDAPGSPSAPGLPSPTVPAGEGAPAGLVIGKPVRADGGERWCEQVAFPVLNTGTEPVTVGRVTFGTHIIGGLGIDWDTRTSTRKLPLPLPPGARRTASYRVCVDAWRVPLGMHIETKDVSFDWKRHLADESETGPGEKPGRTPGEKPSPKSE
ncbi:hypothetical protein [Streptomyces benahoarensis]|uniref:hypothetical protein n=1 Tax=Streptomyces benahoarensis TaxID=2595054 RepID=UPI00163D9691|nr:hypothetical protein [Streptomyces benahoarensis]